MVFRGGLVAKAPQSGVAKLQIEHSELRQADADATSAEMELGITPRRRGSVAKVKGAEKVQRKSDRWLQQCPACRAAAQIQALLPRRYCDIAPAGRIVRSGR